jgi:hypothetical protein
MTPVSFVPWRRRVPALAVVAYVVSLAMWLEEGRGPRVWTAAASSVAVAFYAARRPTRVARAVGWGLAVVLASLGADGRVLDACGAAGALACVVGACLAVARIPASAGVVRGAPTSAAPSLLVAFSAWGVAVAASVAPDRAAFDWLVPHARAWSLGAAAASLLALIGSAEWTRRRRRLELAVVERATAMRTLLVVASAVGSILALLGSGRDDALERLVVAVAAALATAAALHVDAVRVTRLARRFVALVIVGGGVALVGASAAQGRAWDAWAATLVTAAIALLVGAAAVALESPLRPARGAWLDAFVRAAAQATRAEPEDAVREALLALRAPAGLDAPSPELWTFAPARCATVDAAGYLHEEDADAPESIVLVAAGEAEATLRSEVLDALQVRRPELRPLATWMNDRGAMLATVIASDGETEGMLVLPHGARHEAPTLEEVCALKEVADRLATACRARATQRRLLERAREAALRAEAVEEKADRLRHERALDVGRDALAAARLARPATVGVYSAGSRMALATLERRTQLGAPVAVVAASGVDPVPYLARAHLAGARKDAPLVLVDATSAREHDLARWIDAVASPLALADRGTLVLLDGAALPADVQQLVARALAEKRAPWERPDPLDVQLVLTGIAAPGELVASGRLDSALASRLGDARDAPVELPRLRDRGEDLRAIVTDRLAREGLRVLGRPVGIEQAAFARLVDYPFPGEDAELGAIVQRLVASCRGDVVTARDVEELGLGSGARAAETGLRAI